MGSRIKTFNSTGLATAGRLYAGDLNAIQDQYADQSNLAQTVGVGVLQIGESGLQLVRYGAGEARISGALRTDGILRGLGGLFAGTFTTTQRNAISSPPYGLIILNTSTNQFEWNAGTPTTPNWQSLSPAPAASIPAGAMVAYGSEVAPSGWLTCDGTAISRTTYATLYAAIGVRWGGGDGSTTFNLPDLRGRTIAGYAAGGHADVSGIGNNEGAALGSRRPRHKHSVNDPGHQHQIASGGNINQPGSGMSGYANGGNSSWSAGYNQGATTGISVGPQTGAEPTDTVAYAVANVIIKT